MNVVLLQAVEPSYFLISCYLKYQHVGNGVRNFSAT
jgi:hypothetical protein